MADESEKMQPRQVTPQNIGKMILEPMEHAIAAGSRQALKMNVPTHMLLEMHLNHLASILALIEPVSAREQAVMDVIAGLNPLVTQHIAAQTGGILKPSVKDLRLVS